MNRYSKNEQLTARRKALRLTLRDVERRSTKIARTHKRKAYWIAVSRLSEYEHGKSVPGLFKLYSLARIYKLSLAELAGWWLPVNHPHQAAPKPRQTSRRKPLSSQGPDAPAEPAHKE